MISPREEGGSANMFFFPCWPTKPPSGKPLADASVGFIANPRHYKHTPTGHPWEQSQAIFEPKRDGMFKHAWESVFSYMFTYHGPFEAPEASQPVIA